MRHFAHNIGDYAAATAHLSFLEDAAYHRLLRRYYQDEKPLPAALADCQRLVGARTKEEREAVRVVLQEFFTLEDDGWHQARADREIAGYRSKAQSARENGTKGGRPANRQKTDPVSPPVQSEKLTSNQEPVTSSEAKASGAADVASVVFTTGLRWLIDRTGQPEARCRSQLGKWRKTIGDAALIEILGAAQRQAVIDPMAWLEAAARVRQQEQEPPKRVGWN